MTTHSEMRRSQEVRAVASLTLSFGIINFDMFGIAYLMPFIAKDLTLSNTQVGWLFCAFWLAFAVSCALGGALLDALGRRRELLSWILGVFAVASVLPGLAGSFQQLLLARVVLGLVEGPTLPAVHSIVSADLPRARRGMNMGIVQTVGGSILGVIVAPLVLLPLASHWGWHRGFFLLVLPALVCAVLTRKALPAATHAGAASGAAASTHSTHWDMSGMREMLKVRNLWLCAIGAGFIMGFVNTTLGFLPLFLMKARAMAADQTGQVVSLLGLSSAVLGVIIPAISDRLGRKPAVVWAGVLSALCALALGYYVLPVALLALTLFLGWSLAGSSPLLYATIPSESTSDRFTATAIGAIGGIAPITGGVLGPLLAGWSADRWGLPAVFMLTAGLAAGVSLLASGLRETAPLARAQIKDAVT